MNEFKPHVFREKPTNEMENAVVDALRNVYDPEIPVNIYDLGLIYNIDISTNNEVEILMTLTSPFCPATEQIMEDIQGSVSAIPNVVNVDADITFDPPWSPESIPDEVKFELGIL